MKFLASAPLAVSVGLLAACGSTTGSDEPRERLYLPTHALASVPAAQLVGTLREKAGCLIAEASPPNAGDRLLIWPAGTMVHREDDGTAVIVSGRAAIVGRPLTVGGGEYGDEQFIETLIRHELPDRCRTDLYWLVADLGPFG